MDDIRKSLKAILYERSKSPFYGTFILSWIIWNWELLYFFFGYNDNFYEKTLYIRENYLKWDYNLFYPLLSTIVYYPLGFLFSIGFQYIKVNLLNFQKSKVDKWELLSVEQSYELKNEMELREMKIQRELVDLNDKLKQSEEKQKIQLNELINAKQTNELISKEKSTLQKDTMTLKEEIKNHNNTIENLTKEIKELKLENNRLVKDDKLEVIKNDKLYFRDPHVVYSSNFLDYEEGTFNIWTLITPEHYNYNNPNKHLYIVAHASHNGKSIVKGKYIYENVWSISRVINSNKPGESVWRFWCNDESHIENMLPSNKLLKEGWHMFTVTWSKKENKIGFFIDATKQIEGGFKSWPIKNTGSLFVGRWPTLNPGHDFNSAIGNYSVQNKLLTSTELKRLFNKEKKLLPI